MARQHKAQFSTMIRTMLTVFRCFIDGCNSPDGSPLVPQMYELYGLLFLSMYVLVTFFVMFGVFNVMTAIFVEQTSETAKTDKAYSSESKRAENLRVAIILQRIVLKICGVTASNRNTVKDGGTVGSVLQRMMRWSSSLLYTDEDLDKTTNMIESLTLSVTRERFQSSLDDDNMKQMLEDIGIHVGTGVGLFDVLDADGSGKLEPEEVVTGLMKLRGMKDNHDQIATLLGVRALQRHLRDVHNLLIQTARAVRQ